MPVVLYTGSLALKGMFHLDQIELWKIVLTIGVLGSSYAIFGGLKSVAVSDTINGVGLLVGGLAYRFWHWQSWEADLFLKVYLS